MLATLCGWIETVVSFFVNTFTTFYVIGRIIAHFLSAISDTLVEIGKVIAACAVTFYEDATIFMLDIDYHYGHIIKMLNAGLSNSINDVSHAGLAISSSILWFGETTKSETCKMATAILDCFIWIADMIGYWIDLIGFCMWSLLMCIPHMIIGMGRIVITLILYVFENTIDAIKMSKLYLWHWYTTTWSYMTSVPLESICGLITLFFIFKLRKHISRMLMWYMCHMSRVMKFYRRKICGAFKYVISTVFGAFAALFRPLRNYLPNLWELSPIRDSSNSIKIDAFNFCVICQDKVKSIVLLPCRHLCLCSDCFKQLGRYRKECPMCRKTYHHSLHVYA